MKRFIFLLLDIVLLYGGVSAQHKYVLFSPDSLVSVELTIANDISWSLLRKNTVELANSKIGLELSDGYILGNTPIVDNVCYNTCDTIYEAFIYKKKRIVDIYNELVVDFADDFSLVFRAYNEGIAYRIIANRKENFKVKNEKAIFNFLTDKKAYFPYVSSIRFPFSENYNNSFENTYHYCNISDFDNRRLAFLPLVIESQTSRKICITEADLFNYPGMFLYNSNNSLSL